MGNEIERTCRAPSAVGRVTPCAPRLQPAGANIPRRRFPNPLPVRALSKFPHFGDDGEAVSVAEAASRVLISANLESFAVRFSIRSFILLLQL